MGLDMYLMNSKKEEVAYWRKANQIHGWFVTNVQNNVDDCGTYFVSAQKLEELLKTCEEVLKSRNTSLLPPTEGFFFGSLEEDEYYWEDLKDTVKIIRDLLNSSEKTFYYLASW